MPVKVPMSRRNIEVQDYNGESRQQFIKLHLITAVQKSTLPFCLNFEAV